MQDTRREQGEPVLEEAEGRLDTFSAMKYCHWEIWQHANWIFLEGFFVAFFFSMVREISQKLGRGGNIQSFGRTV